MNVERSGSSRRQKSHVLKDLNQFGLETTWHGAKQIAEIHEMSCRKCAWILIVLTAFSAFSYMIVMKVALYYSYESQIEMVTTYEDSLKFPRVTVCNMSPYKMTSVVEAGLYDTLVTSVKAASSSSIESDDPGNGCSDYYVVHPNFCYNPEHAVFNQTYNEVTGKICSLLCTQLEPIRCAGFAFDRNTRVCVISSITDDKNQTCEEDMRTKYYIRQRCAVSPNIRCDFETSDVLGQGNCPFASSSDVQVAFSTVQEIDHTIGTDDGHFLNLMESDNRNAYVARIETPFLYLNETCLQLFYGLTGNGKFRIILRVVNLTENVLSLVSDTHIRDWNPFFLRISSAGIYQVVIEATAGSNSSVSIDDIRIGACSKFETETCRKTWKGTEYVGSISASQSGLPCLPWNASQRYNLTEANFQISDDFYSSFCRNPLSEDIPPWCFIDSSGSRETCGVPTCPCSTGWFRCNESGLCIPKGLICNGKYECSDGSDEIQPCASLISPECGFETDFICGYKRYPTPMLTWERTETYLDVSNGDSYSMHLSYKTSTPGNLAYLMSPSQAFHTDGGLSYYMDISKASYDTGTKLSVYLRHPQGAVVTLTDISLGEGLYLVCIPSGTYFIIFQATIGLSSQPDIILDRIKWHSKDDFLKSRTVGEHCNHRCLNVNEKPSLARFNCSFKGSDCEMTDVLTSSTQFKWMRNSLSRILSGFVDSDTGCMSNISTISGSIISPGYPKGYPDNTDCYITFLQDSAKLTISFTDFELEQAEHCIYDYVTIFNTSNPHSGDLLCGEGSPPNITTSFKSTTLHFHSDYSVVKRGYSFEFSIDKDEDEDMGYGLGYYGLSEEMTLTSRLILPKMVVDGQSCLSFDLMTKSSIEVYSTNSLNQLQGKTLLWIPESHPIIQTTQTNNHWIGQLRGLGSAMHHFTIQLYGRSNEATYIHVATTTYSSHRSIATGLDNIVLQPGRCQHLYVTGSVECHFTDSRQCGYIDISKGPVKWLRAVDDSTNKSGMLVEHDANRKNNVARLLSPLGDVRTASCLNISVESFDVAAILTVSMLLSNESVVLLRSIDSKELQIGIKNHMVDLNVGRYRLLIEGKGWNGILSIVNISVVSEVCPKPPSTHLDDTTGRKRRAFHIHLTTGYPITDIPTNSYPNTEYVEPHSNTNLSTNNISVGTVFESYTKDNEATTPPLTSTNPVLNDNQARDLAQRDILADFLMDQDGANVDNLIVGAIHSWKDVVLRCQWNGEVCDDRLITQEMTNMGLCFVFNADQKNIQETTSPGAEKGLRLLFNIETYDGIDAITSNKGLKVLLDHQDDVQNMRDRGFGIRPGLHSLMSMAYSEDSFLKPDWGTCGELELPYFVNEKYTYGRCTQACAMGAVIEKCQCGDAYMEGQSSLCDMKKYLECILPAAYTGNEGVTSVCKKCISACKNYKYDPVLSSTLLSTRVIDQLSHDVQNQIAADYNKAYELKQRVSLDTMADILKLLQRVIDALNKVDDHTDFHLFDPRSSVIARADKAVNKFSELMTEDFVSLYTYVNQLVEAYQEHISKEIDAFISACERSTNEFALLKFKLNAILTDGIITSRSVGETFYRSLWNIYQSLNDMLVIRQSERFHALDILQVRRSTSDNHTPDFIVAPRFVYLRCNDTVHNYIDYVENLSDQLVYILDILAYDTTVTIELETIGDEICVLDDWMSDNPYPNPMETMNCMHNYAEFLNSVQIPATPTFSYSYKLKSAKTLAELRRCVAEVRLLYEQYGHNRIGVGVLRDRFAGVKAQIKNTLSGLTSNLQQRLVTPLLGSLEDLQKTYTADIIEFVDDAVMLTSYLPNQTQVIMDVVAHAKIWQRPVTFPRGARSSESLLMTRESGAGVYVIGPALGLFRNTTGEAVIMKLVEDFVMSVYTDVQTSYSELLSLTNAADNALNEGAQLLQDQTHPSISSSDFIGANILQIDVYYSDLSLTKIVQLESYDIFSFFSDCGGYMGLLLGASFISLIELIDWIVFHCIMHPKREEDVQMSQVSKSSFSRKYETFDQRTETHAADPIQNRAGRVIRGE